MWGGCWCLYFHPADPQRGQSQEVNRGIKHRLVEGGAAHAALVCDGDRVVGWCQYGAPEELPNVQHNKQYLAELDLVPDYRITCFFVDRDYRRQGTSPGGARRSLGSDRKGRGWGRGVVPTGHNRQEDVGVLPLQRHAERVRAGGLHLHPEQGQEPLRDARDGPPTRAEGESLSGKPSGPTTEGNTEMATLKGEDLAEAV